MTHDALLYELKQSAAVRLLQSPHAALILGFLHHQFKRGHRDTIPHSELVERLEDYLEALETTHPGQYPANAQHYLRVWCDEAHRFLRRYYESDRDDPIYELTPDTERALRWVEELQRSDFVGTESRFLRIFDLLEEIVTYSTEDVESRLARLEAEKAELQARIDAIRHTGQIEQYTQTQIKERFLEASDVARRLLADFREVEGNFRLVAQQVQEKQFEAGARKGRIVGHVLDADAALKESDQGRSFYAFWEFLMSPSKQAALQGLLEATYHLPDLRELQEERDRLRRIKRSLIDGGTKIVESNRRLGEQLRRLLDEQTQAEARRVLDLVGEIKHLVLKGDEGLWEEKEFIWVEGAPEVELPMERQLWSPSDGVRFAALAQGEPREEAEAPLDALYTQFYVDQARLQNHIARLLVQRPAVTLAEVTEVYPIEQGLAEVLAYCAIAAREPWHLIDGARTEMLVLNPASEAPRQMRLPQVIFKREEAHTE